jgi:hypothetical protein
MIEQVARTENESRGKSVPVCATPLTVRLTTERRSTAPDQTSDSVQQKDPQLGKSAFGNEHETAFPQQVNPLRAGAHADVQRLLDVLAPIRSQL